MLKLKSARALNTTIPPSLIVRADEVLVEPGTLDVVQAQARNAARERQRVDGQLCDRFVGVRVRFVVENVYTAIPHLQKIDVSCHGALCRAAARHQFNAKVELKSEEIVFVEPDRDLNHHRHAVIGQHEALERLISQLVVLTAGMIRAAVSNDA